MEGKEGDGSERAGISPPAEVRKTRWSIPMSLRAALSPGGRAFGYQAPLCGTSWQFGFRKFKIRLETFLFDIVIAYSWGWLRYTSWGVWFCFRVWLLFLLNWEVIVGFLCGNCPKITQIVCLKHKGPRKWWVRGVPRREPQDLLSIMALYCLSYWAAGQGVCCRHSHATVLA